MRGHELEQSVSALMTLSRRDWLKWHGIAPLVAVLPGAGSVVGSSFAGRALMRRFLDRAGFGPRPEDLDRAMELGLEGCLEEQLCETTLGDPEVDARLGALRTLTLPPAALPQEDYGTIAIELTGATLLRAIASRRQLYEAMVEFWSDHFWAAAFSAGASTAVGRASLRSSSCRLATSPSRPTIATSSRRSCGSACGTRERISSFRDTMPRRSGW